MPRVHRNKTGRRNGGWTHDTVRRALIVGGYSLFQAGYRATQYMRVDHGKRSIVTIPCADNPNTIWPPKLWNDFLSFQQLRVTTVDGREAIVPCDN